MKKFYIYYKVIRDGHNLKLPITANNEEQAIEQGNIKIKRYISNPIEFGGIEEVELAPNEDVLKETHILY